MIKRFCVFVISLILPINFITVLALAKEAVPASEATPAQEAWEAPEADGVYEVPNHPELRVHVFVHKQKEKASRSSISLVCNLADPDSNAITPAAGWHLPLGDWTYRLNLSSVPSTVGSSNLATISANSFSVWQTAIGNKVNFARGADTSVSRSRFDGQNVIAWGRTSSSALAVTYTWYYTSNKQVAEEDTIFNSRVAWNWSATPNCAYPNYYDVQDIMTHELGHWMGLDDTYDATYADNTMYGYGSKAEVKKDTLTSGDITGVQAIYP